MHVKDLDELEDKARAFRENQGHIAENAAEYSTPFSRKYSQL